MPTASSAYISKGSGGSSSGGLGGGARPVNVGTNRNRSVRSSRNITTTRSNLSNQSTGKIGNVALLDSRMNRRLPMATDTTTANKSSDVLKEEGDAISVNSNSISDYDVASMGSPLQTIPVSNSYTFQIGEGDQRALRMLEYPTSLPTTLPLQYSTSHKPVAGKLSGIVTDRTSYLQSSIYEAEPHALTEGAHYDNILDIAVSTDMGMVMSVGADHRVCLWDLKGGRCIGEAGRRGGLKRGGGHTDWVCCCDFTGNGIGVSGGMDGDVCIWDLYGIRGSSLEKGSFESSVVRVCGGSDLQGAHDGLSISQISIDRGCDIGITAGYDGKLNVWDFGRAAKGVRRGTLKHSPSSGESRYIGRGINSGVSHFTWANSLIASGDRTGVLSLWDVNAGRCVYRDASLHTAKIQATEIISNVCGDAGAACVNSGEHCTDTSSTSGSDTGLGNSSLNSLILSVGADGKIACIDPRCANKALVCKTIHGGTINKVIPLPMAMDSKRQPNQRSFGVRHIVTISADRTCKFWDLAGKGPTNAFDVPCSTVDLSFACVCGVAVGSGGVCVGCADGNVYCVYGTHIYDEVIDITCEPSAPDGPQKLWGYGMDKKGVSVMAQIAGGGVVAGGESGIVCWFCL